MEELSISTALLELSLSQPDALQKIFEGEDFLENEESSNGTGSGLEVDGEGVQYWNRNNIKKERRSNRLVKGRLKKKYWRRLAEIFLQVDKTVSFRIILKALNKGRIHSPKKVQDRRNRKNSHSQKHQIQINFDF